MSTFTSSRLNKALCIAASLLFLQACTAGSNNFAANAPSVEDAFQTTSMVPLKPYTRSIINTTNF